MAAGRVLSAHWTSRTFSEWPSALEWKSKEVGVNHLFSHVCVCCQHACLFCGAAAFGFTKPMCVCPPFSVADIIEGDPGSGVVWRKTLPEPSATDVVIASWWMGRGGGHYGRRSGTKRVNWRLGKGGKGLRHGWTTRPQTSLEDERFVMGSGRRSQDGEGCRIWSTLKLDTPSPYCVWKTHYLCSLLCRQQLSRSRLRWLKESVSYPWNLKRCFRHLTHT